MHYEQNCIKTYTIKTSTIELAAKDWGKSTGKPVIALHGWLDNMASFYPLVTETQWLVDNNIRLITLDWAGHGHSGNRHQHQHYNLLDYVQDLYELILSLELDKVTLLAHSMGGAIATLFAGTFPEKVEAMILIEGLGPLTQPAAEGPGQLAKAIIARAASQKRREIYYDDLSAVITARKQGTDLAEQHVRLLVERNMRSTARGYCWRSDAKLRLPSLLRLTPEQRLAFINKLTMPVLLLYGKNGYVKKYPELSNILAPALHIDRMELDGGHHLHMQFPEQIIDSTLKFINNIK